MQEMPVRWHFFTPAMEIDQSLWRNQVELMMLPLAKIRVRRPARILPRLSGHFLENCRFLAYQSPKCKKTQATTRFKHIRSSDKTFVRESCSAIWQGNQCSVNCQIAIRVRRALILGVKENMRWLPLGAYVIEKSKIIFTARRIMEQCPSVLLWLHRGIQESTIVKSTQSARTKLQWLMQIWSALRMKDDFAHFPHLLRIFIYIFPLACTARNNIWKVLPTMNKPGMLPWYAKDEETRILSRYSTSENSIRT